MAPSATAMGYCPSWIRMLHVNAQGAFMQNRMMTIVFRSFSSNDRVAIKGVQRAHHFLGGGYSGTSLNQNLLIPERSSWTDISENMLCLQRLLSTFW